MQYALSKALRWPALIDCDTVFNVVYKWLQTFSLICIVNCGICVLYKYTSENRELYVDQLTDKYIIFCALVSFLVCILFDLFKRYTSVIGFIVYIALLAISVALGSVGISLFLKQVDCFRFFVFWEVLALIPYSIWDERRYERNFFWRYGPDEKCRIKLSECFPAVDSCLFLDKCHVDYMSGNSRCEHGAFYLHGRGVCEIQFFNPGYTEMIIQVTTHEAPQRLMVSNVFAQVIPERTSLSVSVPVANLREVTISAYGNKRCEIELHEIFLN